MKKTVLLSAIFIFSISGVAQTFRQFVDYLQALPQDKRQLAVESFFSNRTQLPIIESDTLCYFIYKGSDSIISIAGDFTNWNPSLTMLRVEGTDLWFRSMKFEADARLDYKLVINGKDWIRDPRNPYTCKGGVGTNSELRMPRYQSPSGLFPNKSIPHGTLIDTVFYSSHLKNKREVKIYLPPGYDNGKSFPLILFNDGVEFLSLASVNNTLDYMIYKQEIQKVIAVFVPPVDRESEFAGKKMDDYTAFVVDEVMPVIDQNYTTSKDPHERAVAGISNGGNISIYMAMKHSVNFGIVIALSSNVEKQISKTFRNMDKLDLQFYLDIGKYDIPEIIPLVKDFVSILNVKNYQVTYKVWHEGHSWCSWRGHLDVALRQLFPYENNR
jgi:enterochelin esterase-like enzyme